MKVLESGNTKSDWNIKTQCTGKGWMQNHRPCGAKLLVEEEDIVHRKYAESYWEYGIDYGFICPECKCFTALEHELIPKEIRQYCKSYVKPSIN